MEYVKYPRTFHFPWSLGVASDDKVLKSLNAFIGKRVVASLKMDGENTTAYRTKCFARSIDGNHHESQSWFKQRWAALRNDIPEGWRICGENLYAKHSIYYINLADYFYAFSVWNDSNMCLSWDETQEWFKLFNVASVPVVYDGIFDEELLKDLAGSLDLSTNEGFVVRLADEIHYDDFSTSFGKFVRKGHVTSSKHWKHEQVIPNKLKG